LLLASPLLLWVWRRAGALTLVLPLIGIAITEGALGGEASLPWQVQDFALYTFFWLLGFAYYDGRFASIGTPARAALCLVFAAAAAAWALTQDVPGAIVNASYPLHLLVGVAWLSGALALEGAIGRVALRPVVASAVYWVNERAYTIYLWHAAGLFAMYQILWNDPHSALTRNLLALPIVACITFLGVLLFGWVEDTAARRTLRFWPSRPGAPRRRRRLVMAVGIGVPAAAAAAAGVIALMIAGDSVVEKGTSGVVQASSHTVPPSGVGLRLRTERAQILGAALTRPAPTTTEPVRKEDLQAELEAWRAQWQLSGVTVALQRTSGEGWAGASGAHDDGRPFEPDQLYDVASVT
jgi:hypothetical protein